MRRFSEEEEDEFLEDENGRQKQLVRRKKIPTDRSEVLPMERGNATVFGVYPNQSAVLLDGKEKTVLCGYRMSTLVSRIGARERSPVCVGDRVLVEAGVIVNRCERRNGIVRQAPNARNPLAHAIAANIDILIVVASAREPDFSPGIVERFLAAAAEQAVFAALAVNKADLLEPGAPRPWSSLAPVVLDFSAKSGAGILEIAELVAGKTAAFCGHSGVGKTSLLRRLLGDENYGRIQEVSGASGMGRHTTTSAILLPGPRGSRLIDTPGIMNFSPIGAVKKDPETPS